ncbi:hypothetical protein [Actinopolyspora mortivallis]|uniref:PPE family domain-containing protein n=1 Tax=Actinopolyspora mortivallis TaxID=33906 RepID=A0A2T0GYU7_ACTMO|nr:hypothetical protein [Actinopolyspora mortivallis]PRW64286.1 hypothetical protein CEP50_06250 [Actinopolyspora mortivallis]
MTVLGMCYASTARELRKAMAGSEEATSLPAPSSKGAEALGNAADKFDSILGRIDSGLRTLERGHSGRAAEAARASIAEVRPVVEQAAEHSRKVQEALKEQTRMQHETFRALPVEGGRLPDGRPTQLRPPEKNFAEITRLDSVPGFDWTSDYEEKQARFQATNDEANRVMTEYSTRTAETTDGTEDFDPAKAGEVDPGRRASYGPGADGVVSGGSFGSTGTGGAAPAGSSSAWASGAAGASGAPGVPSGGGGAVPSEGGASSPSAGSGSAWTTPPGTVRGPDGTLYRQGPDGTWQRQNPYNGRWAPAPYAPSGAGGGARGAGGATPRGGGVSRVPGGGARGDLAPGGRAGVGGFGPQGGGGVNSGSAAVGQPSGRGGVRGMPAAGAGRQGEGRDEEHERPEWLVETEDVFTNDMQRVAPPVIGETPYEGGR